MVAKRYEPYDLLVADDDAAFRETLRSVLEPHVRLCEATCGEEAVEIVRTRHVDIVLLDMHMRILSGLDTLRIVKTIQAVLPCIILTASVTDDLRQAAARADAFDVLKKPVSRRDLLSTVGRALELAYHDPDVSDWLASDCA